MTRPRAAGRWRRRHVVYAMAESETSGGGAAPAPPAGGAPRSDMVQSAVTFLADPNVQSSPFSQRISFLESKGLTSQEIDLSLIHI